MLWEIFYYYLLFLMSFYIPAILLFIIDIKEILKNYKIQHQSLENTKDVYKKCLPTVLKNTFIWSLPPIILMCNIMNLFNFPFSILKMIFDFGIAYIMVDVLFYLVHRGFHHPLLYKLFHKKHHEITAPVGISALYMTVSDMYFGNIFPVYISLIITSAHPITFQIWLILTTVNTVMKAHSGIEYIGNFHDNHHKYFNKNYGTDLFMDSLFETKSICNDGSK